MILLSGKAEKEAKDWMMEASKVAKKALCSKSKCGTVIVSNGSIIGQGYNAPPLDKHENSFCSRETGTGKPRYDMTCCIHAEWRAIIDALKNNPNLIEASKLYFTRVDDEGNIKNQVSPSALYVAGLL